MQVSGIATDSRALRPGDVFFAVRGERRHGAAFAPRAADAGAAAIVIDQHAACPPLDIPVLIVPDLRERLSAIAARWYGDPAAASEVVAVTGTNGKTTVCHLLADLWGERGGYIGTLGAGAIGALRATGLTTPDAFATQCLLAELHGQGRRRVALEASSHALDQGRLNAVTTRGAVFTNLTRDHLDYHGEMAAYRAAKARVFALPGVRFGVFNLDDPAAAELHRVHFGRFECWSFGVTRTREPRDAAAALRHVAVHIAAEHEEGMDLEIHAAARREQVRVPLVGGHNAANL
ncbi:MAG: UDP-N-acetylmuramoyl-L-alanyl-D-glutamate--2,6-diaminopimelate ligase, partial [Gammaproteobacteria bacterium]|nr:UDP-N-acetylmuramoyl-L-alanyl-D-glutamate--2,6-diaminopimelate ligase [Gammaproteobacteria bacterium]